MKLQQNMSVIWNYSGDAFPDWWGDPRTEGISSKEVIEMLSEEFPDGTWTRTSFPTQNALRAFMEGAQKVSKKKIVYAIHKNAFNIHTVTDKVYQILNGESVWEVERDEMLDALQSAHHVSVVYFDHTPVLVYANEALAFNELESILTDLIPLPF